MRRTRHPYRTPAPRAPHAHWGGARGGGIGQVTLWIQSALVLLCGARLWTALATGAIGFEAILALGLLVALAARIVRAVRRRL